MDAQRYLSPDDVRRVTGLGRNSIYNLFNSIGFPSIRIGKKLLVRIDLLDEWLAAQSEQKKSDSSGRE